MSITQYGLLLFRLSWQHVLCNDTALNLTCTIAGIPPPEGSDDAELLTMSTLNEEGVMNVKQVACDRLLSSRVETKLQVPTNKLPHHNHDTAGGAKFTHMTLQNLGKPSRTVMASMVRTCAHTLLVAGLCPGAM